MPITKQTIAIIGSSSNIGASIAKRLCRGNYRLLLFEEKSEEAETLSNDICSSVEGADVEFLACKHLASWEADVIIISKQMDSLKEISNEIKEVATQKIVAVMQEAAGNNELKKEEAYFPNSKLVGIYPSASEPDAIILYSKHTEALDIIRVILSHSGFKVVQKELHTV
jgi:short-subunit dehydrogenase